MGFTDNWAADWNIVDGDKDLSRRLCSVFEAYLKSLQNKGCAKSTLNRHSNSCHALGGYIVDRVFNHQLDDMIQLNQGKIFSCDILTAVMGH